MRKKLLVGLSFLITLLALYIVVRQILKMEFNFVFSINLVVAILGLIVSKGTYEEFRNEGRRY